MTMQAESKSLRQQAVWVVGWRIVGIVATLASNIVAARLLGPAGFGVYVLVTTVIVFGGILGMAGLNEAGLRFVAERLGHGDPHAASAYLRRVFQMLIFSSLLAACAIAAIMAGYFALTGQAPDIWLTLAASLGVIALAFQRVTAELLRGYDDQCRASLFSGGQTGGPISNVLLLAALGGAAFWMRPLSAQTAVVLTVLSVCATAPVAIGMVVRIGRRSERASTERPGPVRLSKPEHQQLLAVGGVLLLAQLLAFGSQQLDVWLGGAFLPSTELGLYSAAKRSLLLAGMPLQMAMMTILPSIPRLHTQGQTDDLQHILRIAASFAAVPAIAAIVVLALFPVPLLQAIFGGQYAGAAPTVIVLCGGFLILALTGNAPAVLTLTGHHRTVLVVNLLATLILLVGGSAGAYAYGATGLAAGSAVSMAFQNGVLWWLTRKHLGVWTHVGKFGSSDASSVDTAAYCDEELSNPMLAGQNP